jgi:2'-5' RNA ligase
VRTFLAIPLPDAICRSLAEAGRAIAGLRAQRPETIHLTIRFLGEIRDPEPIVAALAPVVAAHPPFKLQLRGLGAFPDRRRATVVWARVGEGQMQAGALAAGVENALMPLGFERERRPYRAHVTLGRFRSPRRLSREALDPEREFGQAEADRLVLYLSRLGRGGAQHDVLQELSLTGGM